MEQLFFAGNAYLKINSLGKTPLHEFMAVERSGYGLLHPRSTRNEFPIGADFGNSRKHPIWRVKRGEN